MTRAITNHRRPVQQTGVPLTPDDRSVWSRAVILGQLIGGGLLVLAYFVALVYAAAFLEILMTPPPCESAGTCLETE